MLMCINISTSFRAVQVNLPVTFFIIANSIEKIYMLVRFYMIGGAGIHRYLCAGLLFPLQMMFVYISKREIVGQFKKLNQKKRDV